jgi:hypothetical protein
MGAPRLEAQLIRLKVTGRLNGADGGSVSIDRERGLVIVRPKFEKREYVMTLQTVAEIVVSRVTKLELQDRERKVS